MPVLATVLFAGSARAATPSSVTHRGDATHDNRVTGAPEPPLGVRWALDMGAAVSYPVIAGNTVFVTVRPPESAAYGTTAVAVDLATGAVRWTRPVAGAYYWSAMAYDQGRVFVLDGDGDLAALAPATGATLWSTKLSQYSFSTPPVAYDGSVYATGAGSGMTAYAVRASDGAVRWEKPLASGAGSPAVDAGTVYVSMVCRHAVALDRATGATRWSHAGDCSGGGEATPALHGGRMYPLGDNAAVYDAASGAVVGAAETGGAVSFADGMAYVPWLGGVIAAEAATWTSRWTSSGTAGAEAPLLAGAHLYVGSEAGYVAALSRADGDVAWCASTAGEPVMGATGNVDRPDAGLGAGAGALVVPAGRYLIAYAPGGTPAAPCTAGPGDPGGAGAPGGPALTLVAGREDVRAGRRVRLSGRVSGITAASASVVRVEADPWPFDDRWRPAAEVAPAADGRWQTRVRPTRNTRYRAAGMGLVSAPVAVYAQLGARFSRRELAGPRFRERVTITGPRSVRLRARREHFYVVRTGRRLARRQASPRLRRVAPGVHVAAATLRYRTSRRTTVVLACYRERTPDPWGRADPIDPHCGAKRLRLLAPARTGSSARLASVTGPAYPRPATERFTAASAAAAPTARP